jgi:hypothetical protein
VGGCDSSLLSINSPFSSITMADKREKEGRKDKAPNSEHNAHDEIARK